MINMRIIRFCYGCLNDTLNDVNLDPGSIGKVIYYFYSSCNIPLKYDSMDALQKTIHQNIEDMLTGGDDSNDSV